MNTRLRRCRPLLGTLVEIRIEGLSDAAATAAIDAAFAEIEQVHRLMSFHEPHSDLSRIHRASPGTIVAVHERTSEVLALARQLSQTTRGVFDITIAAALVQCGALPRPASPYEPDAAARWSDIELLPEDRLRLRRPLWLDLGGIAKGYAVDRAVDVLHRHGATQIAVNAGGDLRVSGSRGEGIFLRDGDGRIGSTPDLELHHGAIATSTAAGGVHIDGSTRLPVGRRRTVSVLASRCVLADALTKVVLAHNGGIATSQVLAECDAQACVHDDAHGWQPLERAA